MAKEQHMLYDLTYFDSEGQKLEGGQKHLTTLSEDEPREMQFMAAAARHPEVSGYEVHLLRPEEAKRFIKAENHQTFWDKIIDHVMDQFDAYGFDVDTEMITMLTIAQRPMI